MLFDLYTRNERADVLELGSRSIATIKLGEGSLGAIPRRPTHLAVADSPDNALRALEGRSDPHQGRGVPNYRFMQVTKPGGRFRAILVDGDLEWRGPPADDEHEAVELLRWEMRRPFLLPHRSRNPFGDFIPLRSSGIIIGSAEVGTLTPHWSSFPSSLAMTARWKRRRRRKGR